MPNLQIEQNCNGVVAGIDEAGRGPWAGPVVAAAVILDQTTIPLGINDSKKISASKREQLFKQLYASAQIGVGIATVEEIDNINILEATKLAMQRALKALPLLPDMTLIDGNFIPELPCKAQAIIKGDSKSLSIAAASIIAKVTRDKMMQQLAQIHSVYGWEKNAGYGTKQHIEAIEKHGITPQHRKSFKPIAKLVS